MKEFILGDCLEGMKGFSDNYFDLAIVDPPYGIGAGINKTGGASKHNSMSRLKHNSKIYNDIIPDKEYFTELKRVSKNQIIFGGNYFDLPITRCLIIWDKMNYLPSMADVEIAWTSFNSHSRLVKINSNQLNRTHISQKPVQLYKWLLKNYAEPHFKILDTHVGSASSLIAFEDFGCEYIGYEIDEDYYKEASKRLKNHKAQLSIFT